MSTVAEQPVAIPSRRAAIVRGRGSALLGMAMLVVLIIVGLITVSGFATTTNIRAMLVFASFLGIAAIGQTLCALVGGLDLSIPYVIGAADIGFLWLSSKGLSNVEAILLILAVAALVGALDGVISYWRPSQSLIVTLAGGFVVLGLMQFVTSSSSESGGTLTGNVPHWLQNAASPQGHTLGLAIAPSVFLWVILGIIVIAALRATWVGRGLYALGGNTVAARLAGVPGISLWAIVFAASAILSAVTGVLLLGFSGGGFAEVGAPYLFTTVAAVVIGGTSLVGGRGGYGLSALGVAILTVLTTVLIGAGLSGPTQQTIVGLLIIPMVALYARGPHPRTQI